MHLMEYVPLFGRDGSYVATRTPIVNEPRMRWLLRGANRARFIEVGALVRHANQWYAHPQRLDAELLRLAEENARRVAL